MTLTDNTICGEDEMSICKPASQVSRGAILHPDGEGKDSAW